MELRPGDKVDRYRIVAPLGAGGMGEVYRAHDTRLQRDIALKILHPEPGIGSESVSGGAARMLREARTVAALAHPNVITIHDVGEIAEPEALRGTPYIAMELIEGRSLRDLLGGPPAPLAERIGWLTSAALALDAAHRAGVIHRDVKPENIMVREDGVVKVLDFGIAKRAYSTTLVDPTSSTEAQLLPQHTTGGLIVGTPYYMAPEQMRSEPLDGRADQFSWGVVAYEVLAGKPPWKQGDALTLVSEVLSKEPPAPSTRNPEVPAHVDALVMRALAKTPEGRFPTMGDLVRVLSPNTIPPMRSERKNEAAAYARTESMPPSATPPAPSPSAHSAVGPPMRLIPGATQRSPTAVRSWAPRVLGAALIAAIGIGVVLSRRPARQAPLVSLPSLSSLPSPSAIPKPPAFPDFGSPMSSVPQALEAYRAGVGAFRDANLDRASAELARAVEADPSFAAAHLRAALLGIPVFDRHREELQTATRLRASLGQHDQALLDAFRAERERAGDLIETGRRLRDLAASNQGDADFLLAQCRVQNLVGEYEQAVTTCSRVIELDPGAAAPYRVRAVAQVHSENTKGAIESLQECLRVSPLATWCLDALEQIQAYGGDCDAASTTAHRLVSADRASPAAQETLAEVLFSSHQPLESVRMTISDELASVPESRRAVAEQRLAASLAMGTGDFAEARARLSDWSRLVASRRSEEQHYLLDLYRVNLALEEDRTGDARKIAQDYLQSRPAWTVADDVDRSMFFVGALYRTGGISRDELVERRTRWLAWAKAQPRGMRYGANLGFAWIAAYAEPAITADDAREALDALPGYLPLPDQYMWEPDIEEPIGKAFHLAGRGEEATVYLTRATRACYDLSTSPYWTWARLELGEVMEARGDRAAACDAYRQVIKTWPKATTSRSVKSARARVRALACAP